MNEVLLFSCLQAVGNSSYTNERLAYADPINAEIVSLLILNKLIVANQTNEYFEILYIDHIKRTYIKIIYSLTEAGQKILDSYIYAPEQRHIVHKDTGKRFRLETKPPIDSAYISLFAIVAMLGGLGIWMVFMIQSVK